MYRAYRIFRNMQTSGDFQKGTHEVCIELMRIPSLWVWLLLQFEESADGVCGLLQDVPLPKWLTEFKTEFGEDDEVMTFGEYYGDDLSTIWHCFIETPISNYVWKNVWSSTLHVDTPLDKQWDNWPEVQWIRGDIAREAAGREWHWTDYPGEGKIFKFVEWVTRPWRRPAPVRGITGTVEPTWDTPETQDGTVTWTNAGTKDSQ
jgi:hypothetical protein